MNIYDVSKHAGVSIATVSRVLNGNPNVSERTREKVLRVMDELGYTPNVFARGLGLDTMQTIGSCVPIPPIPIWPVPSTIWNGNFAAITMILFSAVRVMI